MLNGKRSNAVVFLTFVVLLLTTHLSVSQEREVPADIEITGERRFRKMGIHNANRVRTMFRNQGEVGEWKHPLSGEWPKGTGHTYLDGNALLVAAAVMDVHGNRIHPLEAAYRECMRPGDCHNPAERDYGWEPLPGYAYPDQDYIAMSDQTDTWPVVWPDKPEWAGSWNGYFGRGIMNADQESYFVMDDDADEGFDFYPDATNPSRRGLGLRVAVRGFQWVHVLAQDVIFWHYEITNVGTTDYDSVFFGMYFDTGIGGEGDSWDDDSYFDKRADITYVSDHDNKSVNWPGIPGLVGYAYLESPGNPWDGIDNDDDGLIDERRDSGPGVWLDTYPYGVDDVDNFRTFYGREPKPHWSGDENQNWDPYEDVDGDGVWDPDEPLNDDVGADGAGPLDADYPGPDEGEGDGIPTLGEPDFDKTDKDESDQIGLTGVNVRRTHYTDLYEYEEIWDIFTCNFNSASSENCTSTPDNCFNDCTENDDTSIYYASGPFPLTGRKGGELVGQTERFSMALIFGDDEADILRKKATVQAIYNANYNFSKPPDKPTVTAVPGNGTVTLYWDDRAEQSYDKFLQRQDFEGYMIYRSTEYAFNETFIITDSQGHKKFNKPLAQFDVKNGVEGFHSTDVDGIKFYLGDDTGLVHAWTDTTVQNGQTYYYAVVSYDQGDTLLGGGEGLAPTPCAAIVDKDVSGNLRFDVNTVAVTPNAPAAGYVPPAIEGDIVHLEGEGTGFIEVEIVDPRLVRDEGFYEIAFKDDDFQVLSYSVRDLTLSPADTLIPDCRSVGPGEEGPLFHGMRIFVFNDTTSEGVPFGTGDLFQFRTKGARIDQTQAKHDMDKIAVVPNPYVAAASWESYTLASLNLGRGERKVYFIHLPSRATIRIYSISGHLVDTIEHEGTMDDGSEPWDLVSQDGMDIAYGVYIYHVDAPGIGQKIGKFAVIK
ncbi:MAG: hypothetical protein JSV84_07615 [Gemmatimonadota bacterium]|nr:MAG: hypothetical protein JSV84_07615 [Gemmatimonadota bacterium]